MQVSFIIITCSSNQMKRLSYLCVIFYCSSISSCSFNMSLTQLYKVTEAQLLKPNFLYFFIIITISITTNRIDSEKLCRLLLRSFEICSKLLTYKHVDIIYPNIHKQFPQTRLDPNPFQYHFTEASVHQNYLH